jgi:hypothetical protein
MFECWRWGMGMGLSFMLDCNQYKNRWLATSTDWVWRCQLAILGVCVSHMGHCYSGNYTVSRTVAQECGYSDRARKIMPRKYFFAHVNI